MAEYKRTIDLRKALRAKRAGFGLVDLKNTGAGARPPAAFSVNENNGARRKPHLKPAGNTGATRTALGYLPALSRRALATAVMLALIVTPVINLGAFEAHVINVTARIVNDGLDINVKGGNFCDEDTVLIELYTAAPDGYIIFTLDGSEPVCGGNGEIYEDPFYISETTTISARVCLDGRQSPVKSWQFVFAPEYCAGECSLAPGDFCSQSMGGWGAPCAGGNSGCLRDN